MDKTYKSNVARREARPRSKRLRESGQSVASNVSITINNSGNADVEEGDGHIHSNFSMLESLSADDNNYVYRTVPVESEEGDQVTLQKEKIKSGFADKAGGLDDKYIEEVFRKLFLSKDRPDETAHLLKLLDGVLVDGGVALLHQGAQFGESFAGGLTGHGGRIDGKGYGEMRGLRLWEFLEVPELRYNQVKVFVGIDWQCPGAGIIESVTPDKGSDGAILSTGTATLKLEDGQYGAIDVDDIAMGIFHFGNNQDATEDKDDSKGNFAFAGFATSYWRITSVDGKNNGTFRYALRPGYSVHPQPQMTFACYGNFTKPERQTSTYRTRTYTRRLWKQNTWEISIDNIAAQDGDLSNLSIHGRQLDGYSAYLDNVYFTGTIQQLVKPDGTTIKIKNTVGAWVRGSKYSYYDEVTHSGSSWLCVNEKGSSTEPGENNSDWLCTSAKGADGEPGKDGVSITSIGTWVSGTVVPAMAIVRMGGKSWLSKKATTNPPLWTYTDASGNRLTYADGGYVLTGEVNTGEYELLVENGKDGKDGEYTEFVYRHAEHQPATPKSLQQDDYVPDGWHDDPIGVNAKMPVEWVSTRHKKEGVWSDFSAPAQWSNFAYDAVIADLDNEMDSIALDNTGKSMESYTLTTTASMWSGQNKLPLTKLSVNNVPGISATADAKTGLVTINVAKGAALTDHTELQIDMAASVNGVNQERTIKFTLAGVKGSALYRLVLSTSHISKRKDGYSSTGVSATRLKFIGNTSAETTEGTLKYAVDGGAETTTNNGTIIPASSITSKVEFFFYAPDGKLVDKETVPIILDGEGYTHLGHYRSGMTIPKLGVVTMGGSSYVAKKATTNPPLWTYTDASGNRLTYADGGYILTGEVNTGEYELLAEKGEDGKPGQDGQTGAQGPQGPQGLQGCVIRQPCRWNTGIEYRNDENLKSGTRYIDVALIDANTSIGYDAYKCIKTHTSSSSNKPGTSGGSSYWTKFSVSAPYIFTSLVIAKNASIDFFAGNELVIRDSSGNIVAGMTGGSAAASGSTAVRIWAGGSVPGSAPFRVDSSGNLVATKANITGTINSDSGTIGGFVITHYKIASKGFALSNEDVMQLTNAGIAFKHIRLEIIDGHPYNGELSTVVSRGSLRIIEKGDLQNGTEAFYVMAGSYGLRVSRSSGIQKTTDGGTKWTNL